jgi:hypothetical protein
VVVVSPAAVVVASSPPLAAVVVVSSLSLPHAAATRAITNIKTIKLIRFLIRFLLSLSRFIFARDP